jgi:hypothetical protein
MHIAKAMSYDLDGRRTRRDGSMGPFGVQYGTPSVTITREESNEAVFGAHPTGFGLRNGCGVVFASAMPQRQAELEQLVANLQARALR